MTRRRPAGQGQLELDFASEPRSDLPPLADGLVHLASLWWTTRFAESRTLCGLWFATDRVAVLWDEGRTHNASGERCIECATARMLRDADQAEARR